MNILVQLPEPLAAQAAASAKSHATSLEQTSQLDPLARLNAALAPIRAAFLESGVTEDEAVEDFEREKHAMREERRAVGK